MLVSPLPLVVVWVSFRAVEDGYRVRSKSNGPFTLGHAGAIISGGKGGAQDKMAALENANVIVSKSPADMGVLLKKVNYLNEYDGHMLPTFPC